MEYLAYLTKIATFFSEIPSKTFFYLACAVSDFYLPLDEQAEHKIQSKS
jgi:hypothetical protein